MRFGMLCPLGRLGRHSAVARAENGLDARDVAPHPADPRGIFELAAGALETQVENLLAERVDLLAQLVNRAGPQIGGLHSLHGSTPSPGRVTKRVWIGSLAAASSKASRATSGG